MKFADESFQLGERVKVTATPEERRYLNLDDKLTSGVGHVRGFDRSAWPDEGGSVVVDFDSARSPGWYIPARFLESFR